MRRLAQAFRSGNSACNHVGASTRRPGALQQKALRPSFGRCWCCWWLVRTWGWERCAFVLLLHACSLCSLGAACCWFACLLCAVLRFCWFLLVTTRHPFWFVLVPAEGNRFALGTGGIRCFKPFRSYEAYVFYDLQAAYKRGDLQAQLAKIRKMPTSLNCCRWLQVADACR